MLILIRNLSPVSEVKCRFNVGYDTSLRVDSHFGCGNLDSALEVRWRVVSNTGLGRNLSKCLVFVLHRCFSKGSELSMLRSVLCCSKYKDIASVEIPTLHCIYMYEGFCGIELNP